MKKFFDLFYGRPWRWFMELNFTKKIIFVSIIVVIAILFGERKDANWYYKKWTEDFERAKSTYCSCRVGALKSTRNLEKQERKLRDCMHQFQRYYEYLEDEKFDNRDFADSLFVEIDKYVQREFNAPCK
tara:strand:+ start:139 stop:525 length:387 start_codon:yes stop_codon:yes gene_type:complete